MFQDCKDFQEFIINTYKNKTGDADAKASIAITPSKFIITSTTALINLRESL